MGSNTNICTISIWQWCESKNIWIYASYINTKNNLIADFESRKKIGHTEWELGSKYFIIIVNTFGNPDIDLFASRTNTKCENNVSWHPDPDAFKVDAFTFSWSKMYFYAFPPFSMISKTIEKVIVDKAKGIMVVPDWPTQPWYPIFQKLLTSKPLLFKPNKSLLKLCNSRSFHPLHGSLTLMVGQLCGAAF